MSIVFLTLATLVSYFIPAPVGNKYVNMPNAAIVASNDCNDPITGSTAVINYLGNSTICLLCQDTSLGNLVDGDLTNFAQFDMPLGLSVGVPIVSIKDISTPYPSGYRAGIVVQSTSGLLNTTLYQNFTIKTYKSGVLQETANYGGGGPLEVDLIAGSGSLKRLSFVTVKQFDEIELWLNASLTGIDSLKIYYAFVDADPNCNYNCIQRLTPPSFSSMINASGTGISGLCIFCSVSNSGNVVDANSNNYSTISISANAGGNASIAVRAGTTLPSGSEAGFAVADGAGMAGLLPLNLLGQTTLKTYLNGTLQESVLASSALANIGLLQGSSTINLLSFKSTAAFDEIRLVIGGVSVATSTRVYYAFIRPDADNDGVPDCIDKCPNGNDKLDTDGDGVPNDCEVSCHVNGGPDIYACPLATTAQLPAAGTGQTWSSVPNNPSAAIIDNTGFISNLSQEGIYYFILSEGVCHDTVMLIYQMATLNGSCNVPLATSTVIIDNSSPTGGICLLCSDVGVGNLVDGDQSNYVEYNATLSLLSPTAIVSLRDTSAIYPSGTRAGYVVSGHGGVINASVLNSIEIRTYLNGTLRETAINGALLQASVLPSDANQVRISLVTSKSFNEVELVAKGVLGLLTSMRIYYGFTEPEGYCDNQPVAGDCEESITFNNEYLASINYKRTTLNAIGCISCNIDDIGNLIDNDLNSYAAIHLTEGVGAEASVSVKSDKIILGGNNAGYIVSGGAQLLNISVLQGIKLTTYLGGVLQEEYLGNDDQIKINLMINGTNKGYFSFPTSKSFDEVQLTINGLASLFSNFEVYGAFIRSDVDSDGTPDCYDKCCGSPDYLDQDGNGLVDCVDPQCYLLGTPQIQDDSFFLYCPSLLYNGSAKLNDNNLSSPFYSLLSAPTHGTATITKDGSFQFSAQAYFCGSDEFTYRVCNGNNSDCCGIGKVVLVINDTTAPIFQNFPADLTIQCDDAAPLAMQLQALDGCPMVTIALDETMNSLQGAACNTYALHRKWTASDFCNNNLSKTQVITVEDKVAPNIYHVYTLPNGKKLLAGIAELTNNCWKEIVFPAAFNEVPIVLTQLISNLDPAAAIIQHRSVNKYHFELKVREEELADDVHIGEKVAWIAVEPGVISSSIAWEVAVKNAVNDAWSQLQFSQTYQGAPSVLASVQTNNSNDPASVRVQALSHSSCQIRLQEETSKDIETTHTGETLGYVVVPNNVDLTDGYNHLFGETGTVQLNHQWTTVNLNNKYVNPVVVAGAISYNDIEPVTVRIRNLTTHNFEIQLDEWDYQNGTHQMEQVSYIVVEGSLPTNNDADCVNPVESAMIGWDNCDEYVPISHSAAILDTNELLLVKHTWSLADQCGNPRTYARTDTCIGISLKLRTYLAGALYQNSNTELMRDDLRKKGLLPQGEPYTSLSGFQHIGYGGHNTMKQGMLDVIGNDAIVDWVFIEIRSANNPLEVLATQSALLRRNGQVVNVEGDSVITILGLIQGNYYVSVRHRNHLGIMTGAPYNLSSSSPPFINLASLPSSVYEESEHAYKKMGTKLALWAGDFNGDSKIVYQGPSNDVTSLFIKVLFAPNNTTQIANYILESYTAEDFNLDGQSIYQGPRNDRSMLLINSVLTHPSNTHLYANFIINEILP